MKDYTKLQQNIVVGALASLAIMATIQQTYEITLLLLLSIGVYFNLSKHE